MRRIVRRYLTRDPNGRALTVQTERLTDDGNGRLHLSSERTAAFCSGCHRPVLEISELRGVCDWCHTRGCCVHCVSTCQVCSRRLCGRCRLGFAGPPALTVCAVCQQRLMYRQALHDHLAMQERAFERQLAQQRLLNQIEALRLAADRMHISAQLQAARLGLVRPPTLLRRTLNLVGRGIANVFHYVGRALR